MEKMKVMFWVKWISLDFIHFIYIISQVFLDNYPQDMNTLWLTVSVYVDVYIYVYIVKYYFMEPFIYTWGLCPVSTSRLVYMPRK